MRNFGKLRTVCALAFTVILVMLSASAVFAAGSDRVHDTAHLFTDQEIAEISQMIEEGVTRTGIDMVVVTTDDKKGMGTQEFADAVYEAGGFGVGSVQSGFLYLIDMEDRVPCISTTGGAIALLSDSEIERLLDDAYQYLPDGRYGESAKAVIRGAEASYDDAISKGWTYDSASGVWSEPVKKKSMNPLKLLFSAAASALAAFGATGKVRREYAMEDQKQKTGAAAAAALLGAAGAAFVFANQKDDLLSQHTERRALPRVQNTGGRDGGGVGPHGPSTTHVSGGGVTHGGGVGRKF